MNQLEIIAGLQKLPPTERLNVIESVLHEVRLELQAESGQEALLLKRKKLAKAARVLLKDYQSDDELTAFTALDGEDIHAAG